MDERELGYEANRLTTEGQQLRERDQVARAAHLGKAVEPIRGGNYYGNAATSAPAPERLCLANIDDAMHYQPWMPDQQEAGEIVREVLTAAAKAILRHVPEGAFRRGALEDIINARMKANAGISFRGRF